MSVIYCLIITAWQWLMSFTYTPYIPMQINTIKVHRGTGSWPFSFENSATSLPQADHVLLDLFAAITPRMLPAGTRVIFVQHLLSSSLFQKSISTNRPETMSFLFSTESTTYTRPESLQVQFKLYYSMLKCLTCYSTVSWFDYMHPHFSYILPPRHYLPLQCQFFCNVIFNSFTY